jgi:hypothetical protein
MTDSKRRRRLALARRGMSNGAWSMAGESFLCAVFAEPEVEGGGQ